MFISISITELSIWQMKHRWIGHVLRHDGLLHEIIESRMRGKRNEEG